MLSATSALIGYVPTLSPACNSTLLATSVSVASTYSLYAFTVIPKSAIVSPSASPVAVKLSLLYVIIASPYTLVFTAVSTNDTVTFLAVHIEMCYNSV